MSLKHTVRVPIPNKGVIFRTPNKNGVKYAYFATEIYRDKNGKPTNKRVSIGKVDDETNTLIPNDNYFKYFEDNRINYLPKNVKNFGATFLVATIFDKLELTRILKDSFGEELAKKIEIISTYMLMCGSTMFYIDDFIYDNYIRYEEKITSSQTSKVFDFIEFDEKMSFFKRWSKKVLENEYLAYDVTSISSYSKDSEDVEYGYNRDKDHLPQINLGMYFGETSLLPVFYTKYAGSIVDKSSLKYMTMYNEELGLKKVNFIMDKGFYTKENIKYMKKNNYPFLLCVSNKLITSKKLLSNNINSLNDSYNYDSKLGVYSVKDTTSTYGCKTNVYLYYNELKATAERTDLLKKIDEQQFLLESLDNITDTQVKYYEKYFTFDVKENGEFTFEKDYKKINETKKNLGYFVLISTMDKDDKREILEIYRRKDKVEKSFHNLKNYLDLKRLKTHNASTAEGKIFAAFISLILKSYMEYILSDYFEKNNSTIEKVLKQLSRIRLVRINEKENLMTPITAKQKNIFKSFGIEEDDIFKYVNSL